MFVTDEVQPPAADRSPDAPTGHQARYLEPSYTLPTDQASTPSGDPADRPSQPVSEWARPTGDLSSPAPPPGSPSAPAASSWSGEPVVASVFAPPAVSAPAPVASPTSGSVPDPGSGVVPGATSGVTGTPFAPVDFSAAVGPYRPPSGGAPVPTYPGPVGPSGGPVASGGGRPLVPAPPRESWRAPRRVDPVPGTPFGLVYLDVAPVTSGPAVAALVGGIGSILVSGVAGCLGLLGVSGGWGGWTAGAFAVLAGLLGIAGLVLGELGRRQTGPAGSVRRPGAPARWPTGTPSTAGAAPIRFTGRGMAISGMVCAGVGLGLTVLALAVVLLLEAM